MHFVTVASKPPTISGQHLELTNSDYTEKIARYKIIRCTKEPQIVYQQDSQGGALTYCLNYTYLGSGAQICRL